ncbi:MAG TPA: BamA/TamA family outer membrane protein [Rhodothermales bacterium]|nr:BamA/TamA family outer membrane protein [Rhodothermales bacterium]
MRYILCIGTFLCLTPCVFGQGFNTFSGRNHPELHWRVAETEHFEIMYPARLSGIEDRAAPIAERTYAVLSKNLDVTFEHKIRLYLSDEDEIVNGFAVGVDDPYTNIWVNLNEVADVWTGPEKWLRKVIAHELTHIFHYQAIRSNIGWLANLIANPLPRFWTEGLAQYETEDWDAQRGDRWLRTAVLDDDLAYWDDRSIWNGRLLYAEGSAQVRYFVTRFGDSTLTELLHHKKKTLLGLARVHDFFDAFEATTKMPYNRFEDDWRRHVNIYYNTIAGQLEPADSLAERPLAAPGDYLYDLRYSPDTTKVAVLSVTSAERPVRRLYVVTRKDQSRRIVAEGSIDAPVSWSPDSKRIAYARNARGAFGSLLNDLYVVDADGGTRRRLTHSRRAYAPAFSPDGSRLAFIASEGVTSNIYMTDLSTGRERQVTHFTGNVQLSGLRWHPAQDVLAFGRFDAAGRRDIVLLDLDTGEITPITSGEEDDRGPVWKPDGTALAYTSLRDEIPNVFVHDFNTATDHRVTHVYTGATVYDWYPADSSQAGNLVVISSVAREHDKAYRIDAGRMAPDVDVQVPEEYAEWTTHRPPLEVPSAIPPDSTLVLGRHPYNSWTNITHAATLALPYYDSPEDFGIVGASVWTEPLAKHMLAFIGGISIPSPWDRSLFAATYINNQWFPTLAFNLYRMPGTTRFYGNDLLVENLGGGDVTAVWPLDWVDRPYESTTFEARLRYVDVDPLEVGAFEPTSASLPPPQSGQQADLKLSLTYKTQRPYRYAVTNPLDGKGVRLELTGAAPVLGADSRFVRGDLAAYSIFKTVADQRLYLYGRAQAQEGSSFSQDYVGLSRYDDIQIGLPGFLPFTLGETERVRGYRRYALGNRMLFGTAEYRIPLVPDLHTSLLGILSLGSTSLAAFADGGLVWTGADFDRAVKRLGVGMELKNALVIGGFFEIGHALGIAQPAEFLGTDEQYEVYYRIRAAVPF